MPLYEYECESCGGRFELIRKFADPALEVCALCQKGPVSRLQSAPAFQFKGTGWYITDYAKQGGDKGKSDKTSEETKSKPETASATGGDSGATGDSAPKAAESSSSDSSKVASASSSPGPSATKN